MLETDTLKIAMEVGSKEVTVATEPQPTSTLERSHWKTGCEKNSSPSCQAEAQRPHLIKSPRYNLYTLRTLAISEHQYSSLLTFH